MFHLPKQLLVSALSAGSVFLGTSLPLVALANSPSDSLASSPLEQHQVAAPLGDTTPATIAITSIPAPIPPNASPVVEGLDLDQPLVAIPAPTPNDDRGTAPVAAPISTEPTAAAPTATATIAPTTSPLSPATSLFPLPPPTPATPVNESAQPDSAPVPPINAPLPATTPLPPASDAAPGQADSATNVASDAATPAADVTVTPASQPVLVHHQIVPAMQLVKGQGGNYVEITPTVKNQVVTIPQTLAATEDTRLTLPTAGERLIQEALAHFAYPAMDGMPSYSSPVAPSAMPSQDQGGMVYPLAVRAPITSGFGWRWGRMHRGIDLGAPTGTPVLAAFTGQIVSAGWNTGGYGYLVIIQSATNQTYYAHLSQVYVEAGESVRAGQVIGRVGSTGNSTGPHLHFELRQYTKGAWVPINALEQVQLAANYIGRIPTPTANPMPTAPATATADFSVRVALGQAHRQVWTAASTSAWVTDAQGNVLATLAGMKGYRAVPTLDGAIALNGQPLPPIVLIRPMDPNGLVRFNQRWYRGTLAIVATSTGLTVVNQVPLEHYLASVVGAEVYPSWNLEALKAQAVAARSYAMYHISNPLNSHYDICATEYCQVYKGIDSEHASTNQAVFATWGQVLLDKSGKVLMAQYASTQDLVNEAHRGYGMAQWGAQSLAQQGWNYLQILSHYYR